MTTDPHDSSNQMPQIGQRLTETAQLLEVGEPRIDAVIARGRQRQHRQRTAAGVFAVVGICAGSVAAITVLSRPSDPGRIVSAPAPVDSTTVDTTTVDTTTLDTTTVGSTTPAPPDTAPPDTAAAPSPMALVDSNLVWNRVDPDSSEALASSFFMFSSLVGNGPFLSWSTAPGRSENYAPVLWRSDDALRWQPVTAPPAISGVGLAEHDGRFFALGTAPALSAVDGRKADVAISTSSDGTTWNTVRIPIDTRALAAEPGVDSVSVSTRSLAASDNGILAVVAITPNIDWSSLLPAEADLLRVGGWTFVPEGVASLPPDPCADGSTNTHTTITPTTVTATTITGNESIGAGSVPSTEAPVDCMRWGPPSTVTVPTEVTYTWEELGVSQAGAVAILAPTRLMWSSDGVDFDEIEGPPVAADAMLLDVQVSSFQDGFLAAVYSQRDGEPAASNLMQTTDGRSWSDLGPSQLSFPTNLTTYGDEIAMNGFIGGGVGAGTPIVAVRRASGTWSTTDLRSLVLISDGVSATMNPGTMTFGQSGITVVASVSIDPVAEAGGVELTKDGITMRAEDWHGVYQFLDADTGVELGTSGYMGDSGGVLRDPRTGDLQVVDTDGAVLATFSEQEFYEHIQLVLPANLVTTRPIVLHSTDGVQWSRELVGDIAGVAVGQGFGLRMAGSQVVVNATLADEKNDDGSPKQILLVGTPRN